MNHDVIYDVDIQAARREHAETVNLEVKGVVQRGHHSHDSWIESLQVADLQDAVCARGAGNKIVGLCERGGHRFFNDDVHPEFEQSAADARMLNCRHSNAGGVHAAYKRFNVPKSFRGELLRDLFGSCVVGIYDSYQLRAFQFAIHASMVPAKITGADNGDADFLYAGSKWSPLPFFTGSRRSPVPFFF